MSDDKEQRDMKGNTDKDEQRKAPYAAHPQGNKSAYRSARPMNGAKPAYRGDKSVFGDNKPAYRGSKPAFGDKKPAYRGDKPAFGDRKLVPRGDKPAFGDRKPAYRGDKPAFGDRKPAYRGNKPAFGDRKPAPRGERPAYGAKPAFGAAKPAFHAAHHDHPPKFARPVAVAKPAQTDGLPARRIALEVLRDVTENGAYAALSLDSKLTHSGLSAADRRLVSRLVYDTLEHLLYIDYALNQIMAKPDTDIKLRNVLRLGACQIMLEDRIPESAATNTSVNLCREIGMEGLAGVCNGILRNLVRQKDVLQWPDMGVEPIKAMSVRYSVPEWLVERFVADWGMEQAKLLMGYHQPDSGVTVRPNLMDMDDAAFEKLLDSKIWSHEVGTVPHSWHIHGMADIGQDADFLSGKFSIQGESSMMACMALTPRKGMQVLDACAAPGGKACLLAEMMNGTGRVQAWEMHEHRTKLIAAQAKRLHLENVRPITRDASVHREELDYTMDAVLLDAPCTGLGVMADKPDVKYRVTPESVAELTALQAKLLDAVCATVKVGGIMVYSTCSMLKAENEEQIAAFLNRHPDFKLDKLPDTIPAQFRAHEDVGLQLLPNRDGVGGFYIARMRREKA